MIRRKADGSVVIDIEAQTDKFETSLLKVGKSAITALASVTTTIVGLGVAATQVGKKFETSFAKASTLFGKVDVDISKLKRNILDFSSKTGFAAETLNEALYSALSAGVEVTRDMAGATKFLETNAKLAKAGFTDVDTAVQSSAKVLNAYKKDVKEIDQVANVLIQTQNKGITTVGELSSSLAQVTPTAAAMKVSFEQVGASLAVMTAKGTQTAQATTQLNALFAELGKSGTIGSEGLQKALAGTQYAGKSFTELMESGVQLNTILVLMSEYAKKNNKSMLDMFSSIEAGKAALSISDATATFDENMKVMINGAGTLDEAYKKVTDTLEAKNERVGQMLTNMGIAAYEKFQEPLKGAMDSAIGNIDKLSKSIEFNDAIEELSKAFSQFLKVLIEAGTKALPALINSLTWIIKNGKLIGVLIAGWSGALASLKLYRHGKSLSKVLDLTAKWAGAAEGATTKIKLLTVAKKALDFVLQPKTLLILTAAVAAAGVAYVAFAKNATQARKQIDSNNQKLTEYTKRIQEVKEATKEQIRVSVANMAQLDLEANRLKEMIDSNGQLKVTKEELVTQLDRYNQLAGETVLYYDNETGKIVDQKGEVVNLKKSIEDLLLAKQAQIYIDAYQDDYVEALKLQKETVDDLVETQRQLNEITSKTYNGLTFDEAKKAYESLWETIRKDGGINAETRKQLLAFSDFGKRLNEYWALKTDAGDLTEVARDQQVIIDNVNLMNKALAEGDSTTMKSLLAGIDAETINDASSGVDTIKTKIDELLERKKLLEDSGIKDSFVTSQISELEGQIKTLSDELAKQTTNLIEKAKTDGETIGREQGQGFSRDFAEESTKGAQDTMQRVSETVQGWNLPPKYVEIYERFHRTQGGGRGRGYGGATFYDDLLPLYKVPVPVPEGATFDESFGGHTLNAFNRNYHTSSVVNSNSVHVTQENHFHKEVKRPSEVTREIERTNKELGRAIL